MKTFFAFILLASAALAAAAQQSSPTPTPAATPAATPAPTPAPEVKESRFEEPTAICDLPIQYSPIVDSMKLGMSELEAGLKFDTKFAADAADSAHLKRASAKLDASPVFEKTASGSLISYDGKVTYIHLDYTTKFPTVKAFIQYIAPRIGLARGAFRIDRETNTAKTVCKEFSVELKTSDNGSQITLVDITDPKKTGSLGN